MDCNHSETYNNVILSRKATAFFVLLSLNEIYFLYRMNISQRLDSFIQCICRNIYMYAYILTLAMDTQGP